MPRPRRTRPQPRPGAAPLFRPEHLEPRLHLSAALLRDVNGTPSHSTPLSAAVLNPSTVLFTANSLPTGGTEIWRTDGTAANTAPVVDVLPGVGRVALGGLAAFAGRAYFMTRPLSGSQSLWTTDGTRAGTEKLIDAIDLLRDGGPMAATPDGTAYFATHQGNLQSSLWKTNGTRDGTVPLRNIDLADFNTFGIRHLTAVGNRIYFTTSDPATGVELWKSDGTPAGTVRVTDLVPGPTGSYPADLTAVGDTLYFTAGPNGPNAERSLYRTDGTAAGTQLVHGAPPGFSRAGALANVNGTLFFAPAFAELWKTDGTPAGTVQVSQLPGSTGEPGDLVAVNGRLYFTTFWGAGGVYWQLWTSDGTRLGTRTLRTWGETNRNSWLNTLTPGADGNLYFIADDNSGTGAEVWRSDGTPPGTRRIVDLMPGAADGISPVYGAVVGFGPGAFFGGQDPVHGYEPRITDGTAAGTRLVADVNPITAPSYPHFLGTVPGAALFSAVATPLTGEPGTSDRSLWKTDGTGAGTVLLKTGAGAASLATSTSRQSATVGDAVFYRGQDNHLWKSDGTAAGTVRLTDPASGAFPAFLADFTAFDGRLYFTRALSFTSPAELWTSDGTPQGTRRFTPLSGPASPTRVGDALYFTASTSATGVEWWKTDGTEAGTTLLRDITPGSAGSTILHPTAVGDTLFFFVDDAAPGHALWTSDGTQAGTMKVADVHTGGGGLVAAAAAGRFFFTSNDDVTGYELWSSDGTAAGTKIVKDIYPQSRGGFPNSSSPFGLTASGGLLYFAAYEPLTGHELYRSDGTDAGTVRLTDINPVSSSAINASGFPVWKPVDVNGTLYFAATSSNEGRELWRTDGTDAGTFRVRDIVPGFGASVITQMVPFGDAMLFAADDGVRGAEPWVALPPGSVTARHLLTGGTGPNAGAPLPNRHPALPGQRVAASAVTSAAQGITALSFDLSNLPHGVGPALFASDFDLRTGNGTTWRPLNAAPAVTIARGAGASGTDRVTLTLPPGTVRNTWLRVTVKATDNTGLRTPDVFYVGSLPGDTGNDRAAPTVNALDLARTRAAVGQTSPAALATYDFTRDGRIDALDVGVARFNQRRSLPAFTAPAAGAPAAAIFTPPPARTPARPDRRGLLEADPAVL